LLHDPIDDKVVILNFMTLDQWDDAPCAVEPSEHPFIRRTSTVALSRARLGMVEKLQLSEESGQIIRNFPVSKIILTRVIKSIKNSDKLEREVKDFLATNQLL